VPFAVIAAVTSSSIQLSSGIAPSLPSSAPVGAGLLPQVTPASVHVP
jgi:hypothetical protein